MIGARTGLSLGIMLVGLAGGVMLASPAQAEECRQGYVWRSAAPGDQICVTPQSRQRARQDNAAAESRRAPSKEFGPLACKQGYVWRSAFQGDMVCVTPQVRAETKRENESGEGRARAGNELQRLKDNVVANRPKPSLPHGPDTCKQGFVWREAAAGDNVCVTPRSRERVKQENARAPSLRAPNSQHGPNACKQGYVWRSAFQGDVVCVRPDVRDLVKRENSAAASRRVRG